MVGENSILTPCINSKFDIGGLADVMACLGKVFTLLVLAESPQLCTDDNIPLSYFIVLMMQHDNPGEVVKMYGKDIVR